MTRILYLHGLESGKTPSRSASPTSATTRRWARSTAGTKVTHLMARHPFVYAPEIDTEPLVVFLQEHGTRPEGLPPEVLDPLERTGLKALADFKPDVIVGSSFGGGLAMHLAHTGAFTGPLVLLAPAGLKLFGIPTVKNRAAIVHGIDDDVIPITDSFKIMTDSKEGRKLLLTVADGHRLHKALDDGTIDDALTWATVTEKLLPRGPRQPQEHELEFPQP